MEHKATPCECPLAGFCERHGVHKSAHLHKLCQNHIGYYVMWEDCQGPNQDQKDCKKNASESTKTNFQAPVTTIQDKPIETTGKPELPSTFQMAKNFLGAAADHVKNGLKSVNAEQQQARLAICNDCPHIVEDKSRCGKCGCFLQTKTKWESSSCPIGKW